VIVVSLRSTKQLVNFAKPRSVDATSGGGLQAAAIGRLGVVFASSLVHALQTQPEIRP